MIALVTLATLGRSAVHEFVDWDDRNLLADNPKFNPPTWHAVLGFVWPRNADENFYIPVTQLVWGFLAAIGHTDHPDLHGSLLNPWVFHAASLAVHLATVGVVLATLRLFFADFPAAVGTLLFAIHPIQVETVAWASGFRDLLSGFFGILALWEFIRFRRTGQFYEYLAAWIAVALAMLAKPSAVALPLEAMVVDLVLLKTRFWRSTAWLLPWFAIVLPIIAVTRHVQPMQWPLNNPPIDRPIIALDAIAFYLSKIICPIHLTFDYGRTPASIISGHWRLIWLLPFLLAGLLIWKGRRAPLLYGGCLLALAGLAPVLGLVSFAAQDYSTVSDHYLYPSMLGVAIVGAFLTSVLLQRFPASVAYGLTAFILLTMGIQSFLATGVWSDSYSLFSQALAVNPLSSNANAGMAGQLAEVGDVQGAIDHYQLAERSNPHNGMAIMGFANLLLHEGDLNGAAIQYERLMRVYQMQPNFDPKLAAAGELVVAARLTRLGDIAGATSALEQASRWDPDNPQIHQALDRARAQTMGRPSTAKHVGN